MNQRDQTRRARPYEITCPGCGVIYQPVMFGDCDECGMVPPAGTVQRMAKAKERAMAKLRDADEVTAARLRRRLRNILDAADSYAALEGGSAPDTVWRGFVAGALGAEAGGTAQVGTDGGWIGTAEVGC